MVRQVDTDCHEVMWVHLLKCGCHLLQPLLRSSNRRDSHVTHRQIGRRWHNGVSVKAAEKLVFGSPRLRNDLRALLIKPVYLTRVVRHVIDKRR